MTKMYLIEDCEALQQVLDIQDAKEVEVLDEEQACKIYHDYYTKSPLKHFADYLAANNLQIIKTVK